MPSYERESKEYLKASVAVGGVATVTGVELAVTLRPLRPTTWLTPVDLDDGLCRVLIGPGSDLVLAVGQYRVWGKVTSSPEIPVFVVGDFEVV